MVGDRQALRQRLRQLAAEQRGYFTAAQALAVGYRYQAQKHNADQGNWARVGRGLFRLPDWPVNDDDHLVRWSLWIGGTAVVSHASSLSVHGLGDVDPAQVHLTVSPRIRRSPPPGIVLHRHDLPVSAIEDRGGYRVTTPTRAIAECAADRIEQSSLNGAVAEAMSQGMTTARLLRDAASQAGPVSEAGVERALAAVTR